MPPLPNDDDTAVEAADIAPFLDEILRRLPRIPVETQSEIRRELRVHLESLIAAHEELGLNHADALVAAIGQFGDPAIIARRFRRSYESTQPNPTPWSAMRATMIVFGAGMAFVLFAVVFRPETVDPAFRTYDEVTTRLLTATMRAIFPIVAGVLVGRWTPRRAALGVVYGIAALAAMVLPILLSSVYRFHLFQAATSSAFPNVLELTQTLLWYFAFWLGLGTLAAAATSRISWSNLADGIDSLPAFAARGAALGLMGTLANDAINLAYDSWWHESQRVSHQVPLTPLTFFMLPLIVLLKWVAPLWLGWQIGRTWPLLERWTRTPLAYLLGGAASLSLGASAIHLAHLLNPQHPVWLIVDSQWALPSFFVSLIVGCLTGSLPLIGIVALIAANRARGGSPLLMRAAIVVAAIYVGLIQVGTCAYGELLPHASRAPILLIYNHVLPYFPLAVFAALLWANRDRLSHLRQRLVDRKESHASL